MNVIEYSLDLIVSSEYRLHLSNTVNHILLIVFCLFVADTRLFCLLFLTDQLKSNLSQKFKSFVLLNQMIVLYNFDLIVRMALVFETNYPQKDYGHSIQILDGSYVRKKQDCLNHSQ